MKRLIQKKPVHPAKALRNKAYRVLKKAIENGTIPKIKSDTKCVDCGKSAQCYEHRDYSKPLLVEPVCYSCNGKRGPGEPRFPTDQTRINSIVDFRKKWHGIHRGISDSAY